MSAERVKLTKAQRASLRLLESADRITSKRGDGGCYVAFISGPEQTVARNLAAKELIEWSAKTYLGRITDAGRAALSPNPSEGFR